VLTYADASFALGKPTPLRQYVYFCTSKASKLRNARTRLLGEPADSQQHNTYIHRIRPHTCAYVSAAEIRLLGRTRRQPTTQHLYTQSTPAYVRIRQLTSAYVRIRQCCRDTAARAYSHQQTPHLHTQNTPAYVSTRAHTCAYVSAGENTHACSRRRQREHTRVERSSRHACRRQ
jgi:hypothetical protein